MKLSAVAGAVIGLVSLAAPAAAWGAAGHQIVATLAQIHLLPSARQELARLLPQSKGHLAPIATWADNIKWLAQYKFASELHYTSPLEDYPPARCHFGDRGWKTEHDVLHAIANYTTRLYNNHDDYAALRFLVHFVGDVHQPLHLTDRERGGNDDFVRFENRKINLHSLWDTALITKAVREQSNYTKPLPSAQIEDNLQGAIYDPYIRLLLWEGVRVWWRSALPSWFTCPHPLSTTALSSPSQQLLLSAVDLGPDDGVPPPLAATVCPQRWAEWTHQVTCGLTFPPNLDRTQVPPMEVNTAAYYGPIREGNVVEELLVRAGLRLAATLNAVLGEEGEVRGMVSDSEGGMFGWIGEAEAAGY